eukprot:jgi/Ulvmu1/8735/UM047_0076.1
MGSYRPEHCDVSARLILDLNQQRHTDGAAGVDRSFQMHAWARALGLLLELCGARRHGTPSMNTAFQKHAAHALFYVTSIEFVKSSGSRLHLESPTGRPELVKLAWDTMSQQVRDRKGDVWLRVCMTLVGKMKAACAEWSGCKYWSACASSRISLSV